MGEEIRRSSVVAELAAGRPVTYFTVGVSMQPLLYERQTHTTVIPLCSAQKGDLLLYVRPSGALVLHRCMRLDDDYYYMRGDNTYGLERICKAQAIGIATNIYRKGKSFALRSHRPYRVYVRLWNLIYPIRWLLWKCRRTARRLLK